MKAWILLPLLLAQESPVKSIAEVARKIEAGSAEFLKGAAPAEAWKPWPVAKMADARVDEIRKALKDDGISKMSALGVEFELHFFKDGKGVATLQGFVYTEGPETSFIGFKFRADPGLVQASAIPFEWVRAWQPEVADSMKLLLDQVKAKKDKAVPFADADKIAKRVVFGDMVTDAKEEIEKSQAGVAEACEKLSTLEYTEVRLRLDDCPMLALAEDGTPKGILNMDLVTADQKVAISLSRYKPFKKR